MAPSRLASARVGYVMAVAGLVLAIAGTLGISRTFEASHVDLVLPPASPDAPLLLLSCTLTEETSFLRIEGRVRNVSPVSISDLAAVGEFFGHGNGPLVRGQSSLYPIVLNPGASGYFQVVVPVPRRVEKATLSFVSPDHRVLALGYPDHGVSAIVH